MDSTEVKEVTGKKSNWKMKTKLIAVIVIIVVAVMLVGYLCFRSYKSAEAKYVQTIEELKDELEEARQEAKDLVAAYEKASKEVDIGVIKTEIKEIGELATIEYLYTDANRFSDPKKIFDFEIPFTTKSFIVKWDGIIKAGIEVGEVTVELNEEKKEIIVGLSEAKILSHELDENSFETLDESSGLFNPIKVEDVHTLEAVGKEAMEQRAMENGLLEKAGKNAEEVLSNLILSMPNVAGNYTIVFEEI